MRCPYLFTALKIAAPIAVITAFVSEYFGGSQNGLGYGITSNAAVSRTDGRGHTSSARACSAWRSTCRRDARTAGVADARPAPRSTSSPRSTHDRPPFTTEQPTQSGHRPRGSNSMNKQRVRVAAAAVVALAVIGAACGSDDDSSSEPSDTPQHRSAGRLDRWRRARRRLRDARADQPAAAVVHPGPVRRLLRRGRTRASTRTCAST